MKFQMGLEFLWGVHPIDVALRVGRRKFTRIFMKRKHDGTINKRLARIESSAKNAGIDVQRVPVEHIENLVKSASKSTAETVEDSSVVHQGILALVSTLKPKTVVGLDEIIQREEDGRDQMWLCLDKIHDPMNLGAIIRSSAFFGVSKIMMNASPRNPLSPLVSKASSGAMEVVPVYTCHSLPSILREMKSKQWNVYASTSSAMDVGINVDRKREGNSVLIVVMAFESRKFECKLCGAEISDLDEWERHVFGKSHKNNLEQRLAADRREADSRTVCVSGAPWLSQYGNVWDVVGVQTKDPAGYFIAEFGCRAEAEGAVEEKRGSIDGFPLQVQWRTSNATPKEFPNPLEVDYPAVLASVRKLEGATERIEALMKHVEASGETKSAMEAIVHKLESQLRVSLPDGDMSVRLVKISGTKFCFKESLVEVLVTYSSLEKDSVASAVKDALETVSGVEPGKTAVWDGVTAIPFKSGPDGIHGVVYVDACTAIWEETRLLRAYSGMDLRLRYVLSVLSWWGRRERITGHESGLLSETAFLWLVIAILAGVDDPALRVPSAEGMREGSVGMFETDLEIEEIIARFFKKAAVVDFSQSTVLTGVGTLRERKETERNVPLVSLHPIDPNINIGATVSFEGVKKLVKKVKQCAEIFSLFGPNNEEVFVPAVNGVPLLRPLRSKSYQMLQLLLGHNVASTILLRKGTPKRSYDHLKPYNSTFSLPMDEFSSCSEDNESDVENWCSGVARVLERMFRDILAFEVKDVTSDARSNQDDFSIDYKNLATKLEITFDDTFLNNKDSFECATDQILSVFFVQAFYPTWERRTLARDALGDSWMTQSFTEVETKISREIVKSVDAVGKPKLPWSTFLVEVTVKQAVDVEMLERELYEKGGGWFEPLVEMIEDDEVFECTNEPKEPLSPATLVSRLFEDEDDEEAHIGYMALKFPEVYALASTKGFRAAQEPRDIRAGKLTLKGWEVSKRIEEVNLVPGAKPVDNAQRASDSSSSSSASTPGSPSEKRRRLDTDEGKAEDGESFLGGFFERKNGHHSAPFFEEKSLGDGMVSPEPIDEDVEILGEISPRSDTSGRERRSTGESIPFL
ncbi:unnamed protein product [Notodromas monacha]|uniref:rRNA methyltransferase 1, mitochondrial n=1 Tax=Notodromas monacha TaxID=399045 RepID=A0A7R9BMJ4_9CRUS|nr:unnamed protein product [Notodromas monacha]CAG0917367.1 unnamed protein product [Notodromas monacha]